jgi:hypothetical protein
MAATNGATGKRQADKKPVPVRTAHHAPHAEERGNSSDLLTITIDTKTGQIVKIEKIDRVGRHHEPSDQERADLAKVASLEGLIEEAFEVGMACMLGDSLEEDETEETDEESRLRHLLLEPLIKQTLANRLMRREALGRAILGTVVRQTSRPGSPTEGSSARQRPGGHAGKLRQRGQLSGQRHGSLLSRH